MVSYEKLLSQLKSGDLSKLEKSLIENIREKESKSKGFSKKLPIIKRIVKSGERAWDNKKFTQYHKFTYQGKEYNAFLDKYMFLAIQEETFGYNECENPFNVTQLLPTNEMKNKYIEIDIDMVDLKTFAKISKTGKLYKPYIITLDGIRYGVNPQFLLDALNFNETITIQVMRNNPNAPIILQNDAAKTLGFVLPMKIQQVASH